MLLTCCIHLNPPRGRPSWFLLWAHLHKATISLACKFLRHQYCRGKRAWNGNELKRETNDKVLCRYEWQMLLASDTTLSNNYFDSWCSLMTVDEEDEEIGSVWSVGCNYNFSMPMAQEKGHLWREAAQIPHLHQVKLSYLTFLKQTVSPILRGGF